MSYTKTTEKIHKTKNIIRVYSSLIERIKEVDPDSKHLIQLELQKKSYELDIEEYANLHRKTSILYSLYGKPYKDLTLEEKRGYTALLARKRREGKKELKD